MFLQIEPATPLRARRAKTVGATRTLRCGPRCAGADAHWPEASGIQAVGGEFRGTGPSTDIAAARVL